MPKVHKLGDTLYVAICGFQSDNITVYVYLSVMHMNRPFRLDRLKYRKNLYELRENREVKPMVLTTMLSNLLYERR
jgi:20S proteasome subunit beta 3